MYEKKFVLSILHGGQPVREINNTVHLPYNSEYKIRLKNKHGVRAKVKVWIDGRQVSNLGDFILNAGATLDLERFLDASMSTGNRFQFVPLSDKRVNDPTDAENGIIKVEFYKELTVLPIYKWNTTTIVPMIKGGGTGGPVWPEQCGSVTYTSGGVDCNSSSRGTSVGSISSNYMNVCAPPAGAGATVEGSISGQTFSYGSDFSTEVLPIILTLKIRGLESIKHESAMDGVVSGSTFVRFCHSCGARRRKKADRFCGRCGVKYVE